jgi:hypothetical protein
MAESGERNSALAKSVATGKDLVAMLRDSALLLIAVMLLVWPRVVNNILVEAGFEEGSFAGLKWKASLETSDDALIDARATIADLREQNAQLGESLAAELAGETNPDARQIAEDLVQQNERLLSQSAMVQSRVTNATSANAALVEKAQAASGTVVTWGVVYGGDKLREGAQYEVDTIAPKFGLPNAAIYHRRGSYRSVATTTSRLEAEQLLVKAKSRRPDAYIVNMDTWCPSRVEERGIFLCNET